MAKIVLEIQPKNKEATQSVKLLNAEVKTLSETLSTIKVNKNLTTQINALTKHYNALAKAAVKVNEATVKRQLIDSKVATQEAKTATEKARKLTQLKQEALLTEKANTEISKQNNLNARTEKTIYDLAQAKEKAAQSTQKQTTATKQGTKVNEEHRQSILSMTRGILEWQIATTLVMKPLRLLQNALQDINETLVKTEDAVISLQRVLPSGSASDSEISSRLYKIAQDYGQTFENVSQITTNFARTGMSWADTIKAAEAAVLALNVAELDATEASDGLISILTQFNKETSNLTEVVDKLNKAADNNPVTTEKLLKALQRTGAAAKQANINLDDTIGIITTLSKATNRSGENLGTAVNSLIQFSSKSKSLETFAKLGGSVETAVEKYRAGAGSILEIWEELGKVVKDRQGSAESILGGGLFGDEEWESLNEELKETLGESYADITDIYDTASTFRKNYFIALLNDMDNVKKVTDDIANAQGYSQAENQKYLDTYTAKQNELKAKWQEIANDEQGWLSFKKGLAEMGTGILQLIDHMGGLKAALIPVATIFTVMFAGQIMSGLVKFSQGIKNLGNNFRHPLKNLKELKTATAEYNAALKAQSLALKEQKAAATAQAKATELQTIADQKATIAAELKTANEQAGTVTSEMATAAEQAQAVATETQTIATKQQAIATELNTKAEQKAVIASKQLTVASKAMGAAASSAAGIWGVLAFAIYEVINIIDQSVASAIEKQKQEIEDAKETLSSFVAVTDEYNEKVSNLKDYSEKIKNINGVLQDENSSALQLEYANNQLLSIQNELIKSNEEYANSLDLVNGKLSEQSEIVRAKTDEEAQKLAKEYLERNSGALAAAQKIIDGTNSKITLGTGDIATKFGELGIIDDAKKALGLDNLDTGVLRLGGEGWVPFGGLVNEAAEAIAGNKEFSVWDGFIERGIQKLFTKEGWAGSSTASLSISGDVSKQLETIEQLRKYINDNKSKYDEQDVKDIQSALEKQYQALNSSDYQNALKTIEANEMYTKYVEGGINLGQLQSWLAGDKEWSTQWVNSLEHLSSTAKENLINAMEEARDLQKEALELSEKQLAVEEARIALQNAQNQATVRRFNEATGQWEWQVDEKKVAEAQEKLNEAKNNLTEYTEEKAWNETKSAIEKGNATNQSILEIIAKWAQASMSNDENFGSDIYNILKANGIDLKEKEFKVNGDGTQEVVSYDSGGIANGLGFMPKATSQAETVNNPDLTAKILSPVSNAEFNRYVKDMGIMFEQSHNYARMPQFERINNTSTDNSVNNSGQINFAGGLTVGSDKRGSSIDEMLSMFGIVPNN